MTARKERILVISHGHPDFSLGGGEIAAYNLFKAYREHDGVEDAYFLGIHHSDTGACGEISLRRNGEFLWDQTVNDWFRMASANIDAMSHQFAELVLRLRPTVVHFHHFLHLGLEAIQMVRRVDPDITIMMTLHEYVAICWHHGQMVKTDSHRLCFRESPEDCVGCFPDRTMDAFWLRKHRYQSYFALVDQFVAPSSFLRQRYIDWGIDADRIEVIENGQSTRDMLPPRPLPDGGTRNRFAFFGQITPFKGVDLLLRGLSSLSPSDRRGITLEIHGANLENQRKDFRKRIAKLRKPLEQEGVLQWIGPYEPFQMADRIASADWVVIPSIWWENSPMVIQEAFTLGRPVVGSDIGGMAEKITDGVDGVHVPVSNPKAWGEALLRLSRYTDAWDELRAGITPPSSHAECATAHMTLIKNLNKESA